MYLLQNACILSSAAAAGALLWLAGGGKSDPRQSVAPAVRSAAGAGRGWGVLQG